MILVGAVFLRADSSSGDFINLGKNNDNDCSLSSECFDDNKCTIDFCNYGTCMNTKVVLCYQNDGCCPKGCNPSNDNDCILS